MAVTMTAAAKIVCAKSRPVLLIGNAIKSMGGFNVSKSIDERQGVSAEVEDRPLLVNLLRDQLNLRAPMSARPSQWRRLCPFIFMSGRSSCSGPWS